MNRFEKYGFVRDENKENLKEVFNENNIEEVHIDLYIEEPYMLLSRIIEKDIDTIVESSRIVIKNNRVVLVDVLLDYIDECFVKKHNDMLYNFVFKIHNICYKFLVAIQDT